MKRAIAIFFLTIFTVTATEAHQLLRVPVMIQHFKIHKQEDPSTTFFKFIALHYFSGDPVDADYGEDMKLPFRDASHCLPAIQVVTVPDTNPVKINPPYAFSEAVDHIVKNDCSIPIAYLDAIFQPPRL